MLNQLRALLERRLEKLTGAPSAAQAGARLEAASDALRRQGNGHLAAGEMAQAESCFREALKADPNDVSCVVCLGYALKEQGRFDEAYAVLQQANGLAVGTPQAYEAHYLQGEISKQQGDTPRAVMHLQAALRSKPDFTPACKDLLEIHRAQADAAAAREVLKDCVRRQPECLEYRLWATEQCLSDIDYAGVVEHLTVAMRLGATAPDSYLTLGAALCRLGRVAEGEQKMDIGVALDPTLAAARHYELGCQALKAGSTPSGLEHMAQVLQFDPENLAAYSAILMTMSSAEDRDDTRYRAVVESFAAAVRRRVALQPLTRSAPSVELKQPGDQRLRVGFVSGDLLEHPVTFFLLDVLRELDRQRVYLVAYSNNVIDHAITASVKSSFDEWHEINRLTDAAAADLVRSHRMDVLIDLGGHTGDNRLCLFGWRPAPVQVTWLGYWASTGLDAMDFILTDKVSVPEDSAEWFSEKIYRLPHTRLCMSVPKTSRHIPLVSPPCMNRGYLTFGSFQQVAKIRPQVLKVWAAVMGAVPDSRLRIQTRGLDVPAVTEKLSQEMVAAGIDLSRVHLLGAVDLDSYLEAHNQVDILLDTFPYPGGTTTAFALWMGVPTITMTGRTMISRQGMTMLACVALDDWIAQDERDYVAIAKRMDAERASLEPLRADLRGRALASPLFNAKRFAIDFHRALEEMVGPCTSDVAGREPAPPA
ncbi:MAG: tetratricopeptide repeat protein [Hylemonella sp.]|nr:tetratricopeptide repeat protein [Hylemonella sp.]